MSLIIYNFFSELIRRFQKEWNKIENSYSMKNIMSDYSNVIQVLEKNCKSNIKLSDLHDSHDTFKILVS